MIPSGKSVLASAIFCTLAAGAGASTLFTISPPSPLAYGLFLVTGHTTDLNGDSRRDLVAQQHGANRAYILNSANGAVLRTFTSPAEEAAGNFGSIVSVGDLTGDGREEILIGAAGEDPGASPNNAGRAYLFSGDSAVTAPIATFVSPGEKENGFFGNVASLGDLTGDGKREFAIVAAGEGKCYVYDGGTLTLLRTISSPGSGDTMMVFGVSDLTADGVPDIMLSTPLETVGSQAEAGRVYLLSGADGVLIHTFQTSGSETTAELFGGNIAELPDLTGDSVPEVAISAQLEVNVGGGTGRVYVYNGAARTVEYTLAATDSADSGFGAGLTVIDDLDGDGTRELAVGSQYGISEGRVKFFNVATGAPVATLYDNISSLFQDFSYPVALPNFEGDSRPNFVVNALGGGSLAYEGKVYVYNGLSSKISVFASSLTFPARDPNDGPSSARGLIVYSEGDAPLKFTGAGIAITGPNAADFSFSTTPNTADIPVNSSRSVSIVFDPSATGTRTASLVITTDDPTNPTKTVPLTGTGDPNPPTYSNPIYLVKDGDLIVVDSATGNRHLLSSSTRGDGPLAQTSWTGLTLSSTGSVFVTANDQPNPLLAVAANGDRSAYLPGLPTTYRIARAALGTGSLFYGMNASGALVAVDTAGSGHRVVSSSSGVGTGPTLYQPTGIALEPAGTLLLADPLLQNILRVDTATGNRSTIISGTTDSAWRSVAAAQDGAIYGVTGSTTLWRVDGTSGTRTAVSSNTVGTGQTYQTLSSVTMATASSEAFVYDAAAGAILRVDLATGNRTVVSSLAAAIGTGPTLVPSGPPSTYALVGIVYRATTGPTAAGKEWMTYE